MSENQGPGPTAEELQALQAAEDAKADPSLDEIEPAAIEVAEVLRLRRRVSFVELLLAAGGSGRSGIIAAFLAILEMAKLRLLRVVQAPAGDDGAGGEILVEARETLGDGTPATEGLEEYR